MRKSLLAACFALALTFCLARAADPDNEWIDLTSEDLGAWKGTTSDWIRSDAAELDAKNPKLLSAKPGKGAIIVNGPKGNAKDLVTKRSFGDLELQLEFLIGKGSNSGVKFHAHYEIQIYDSFGVKELDGSHCGGIYPRAELKPRYMHIDKGIAPKVNACKEPGQWQKLEVIFLAPRFDGDKKTANAKIVKAVLNGQVIHEDQELQWPTGHNWKNKEMAAGPLLLQGDHGPVAFRNVRVRPYKP
jgi:hypothetical protein